uniref:Uncharacterized protein n=1 Tax=Arundo donax TaxID=35708 RepID=A0A0A9EXI0_ARUDO
MLRSQKFITKANSTKPEAKSQKNSFSAKSPKAPA